MAVKLKVLMEETTLSVIKAEQIDEANCVIRGVKLCGWESKNGYTYSPQARKDILEHYKRQMDINEDHPPRAEPDRERKISEGLGLASEPEMRDDGIYGNFHYLESHPTNKLVIERAKRMPTTIGFSHNAKGIMDSTGKVVQRVPIVRSLDLVRKPATTKGLFESEDAMLKMYDDNASAGTTGDGTPTPPAAGAPAAPGGDAGIKAAFRQMVIAAFDDESLDTKATIAKIKQILAAQDKLMGTPATPTPDAAAGDATPTMESVNMKKQFDALEAKVRKGELKDHATSALEAANVTPSRDLVESLSLLSDEKAIDSLIAAMPKATGKPAGTTVTGKPKTVNLQESQNGGGGGGKPADKPDRKAVAASLRS